MGLKIRLEDGRNKPVVICDHCGEEIDDARKGNYQWQVDAHGVPIADGRVSFTHKDCCRSFEAANGGRPGWCWAPLSCLPAFLVYNLQLGWEEAKEAARLMNSL